MNVLLLGIKYKIPIKTNTITINNYYAQKRQINGSILIDLTRSTIYGGILYEDRTDRIYHFNLGLGVKGPSFLLGMSIPVWTESKSVLNR